MKLTNEQRAQAWAMFMAADLTNSRQGGPSLSATMADKALFEFDKRFNCSKCEGLCNSPTHHGQKGTSS